MNTHNTNDQRPASERALAYSPFSTQNGEIRLMLPPSVYPSEMSAEDAATFGTILRVAELSIVRSSSHAVPDASRVPALEEIDRLRALFPAPPTQLEKDLQRMGATAKALARATGELVHSPTRIVQKFSHSPRHSAGREK